MPARVAAAPCRTTGKTARIADRHYKEATMCGCMLMHAAMNHEGHEHVSQPGSASVAASSAPDSRCAHCGFPLQAGYAFCPNCGMSLAAAKCSACGQKVDLSWKNCAYCGTALK
ncbi:MAG: zinc ribbon domain-containing protein [Chloroflexota bacterium]